MSFRRMRMRVVTRDTKTKIAWSFFILIFFVVFIDTFGFVKFYFEKDFETEFVYPLDVNDFPNLVHRFRNGENVEYEPLNKNYSSIKFEEIANQDCGGDNFIGLLILVKSAPEYFEKRAAIRATWGNPQYLLNISNSIASSSSLMTCFRNQLEKNLSYRQQKSSFSASISQFPIKLVFLVGHNQDEVDSNSLNSDWKSSTTTSADISHNKNRKRHAESADANKITNKDKNSQTHRSVNNKRTKKYNEHVQKLEDSLRTEILKFNDIIRADFVDSYENNTYKTMIGLRWAIEICSNFQYAFLVDDDMYISVKNLVRFMEAPKTYPLSKPTFSTVKPEIDNYYSTEKIFAGKIIITRPIRNKFGSKWYLSLDEYPFNYFPPYLPAASILMSKSVVEDFYFAASFTKHFRFDDIFLGILANKLRITPFDSNYFHVCHNKEGICSDYERIPETDPMQHVIARHGLSTKDMIKMWNQQKLIGNC